MLIGKTEAPKNVFLHKSELVFFKPSGWRLYLQQVQNPYSAPALVYSEHRSKATGAILQ